MKEFYCDKMYEIVRVLNAPNPVSEYIRLFGKDEDSYALFCDGEKETVFASKDISGKVGRYYIAGTGNYRNALYIDYDVVNAIIAGRETAETIVKTYIGFDSNFISDASAALHKKVSDEDIYATLKLIKRSNCQISYDPYYYEDVFKESGMKNLDKVYEVLRNFCTYERMTEDELDKTQYTGVVSNEEDIKEATEILSTMIYDKEKSRKCELGVNAIYCLLLQTDIIRNTYSRSTDKMAMLECLVDFVNNELGLYFENILYLCMKYLINPDDVSLRRFFGKMSLSSKNLFRGIESMAWDLWHYNSMPLKIAEIDKIEEERALYYFVTGDKGFAEVMESNPLQRVVFYRGVAYPKFKYSLCDIPEVGEELVTKLEMNGIKRKDVLQKNDFKALAQRKERELLEIKTQKGI